MICTQEQCYTNNECFYLYFQTHAMATMLLSPKPKAKLTPIAGRLTSRNCIVRLMRLAQLGTAGV